MRECVFFTTYLKDMTHFDRHPSHQCVPTAAVAVHAVPGAIARTTVRALQRSHGALCQHWFVGDACFLSAVLHKAFSWNFVATKT